MANPVTKMQPKAPSRLRSLVSHLLERSKWADRLTTFEGRRNVSRALGYKDILQVADYRDRYERGGIAERIVEGFPAATWATGARLVEDPDPSTETAFERAARELFDRLEIWQRLYRADVLAGLGTYAVILIGAPGNLNEPLPDRLNGPEDIAYLTALAEDRARIDKVVEDERDPRFGLPLSYSLGLGVTRSLMTGRVIGRSIEREVHYTRVLHVAEGMLEDDVYGKPRLRAVWNRLDDLEKIVGGGSEAAWKRMDPGMQVDVPDETEMDETEEDDLSEEVEEYLHGLRRFIRTRGKTAITPLAASVAGFGPNASAILQLIAGITGYPMSLLVGSERGQLASDQNRLNWSDRVNERRSSFAAPLVRLFIRRMIGCRVLPNPEGPAVAIKPGERALRLSGPSPDITLRMAKMRCAADRAAAMAALASGDTSGSLPTAPGGFEIAWPEVGGVDNLAKSSVIAKLAAANQAQAQTGQPVIIKTNEIRHIVLGLGPVPEVATPIGVAKTTNVTGTSIPDPPGAAHSDQSVPAQVSERASPNA